MASLDEIEHRQSIDDEKTRPDRCAHAAHDLDGKALPLLHRAAPVIAALVAAFDQKLVERGRDIFENGTLKAGSLSAKCTDCHADWKIGEDFNPKFEPTAVGYPDLTGYASQNWLKEFIGNPGHALHYGPKNQMPAYGGQFSPHQFNMLVRWMTGDYYKPKKEHGE